MQDGRGGEVPHLPSIQDRNSALTDARRHFPRSLSEYGGSPIWNDEVFPGHQKSRDLLQRSKPGLSHQPHYVGVEKPLLQNGPADPPPGGSNHKSRLDRSSSSRSQGHGTTPTTLWPKGPPPKAPRSYNATVSPPAQRRIPQAWGREAGPGFRQMGDSWQPDVEYSKTWTFTEASDRHIPGYQWHRANPVHHPRLEQPNLRDTFRPLDADRGAESAMPDIHASDSMRDIRSTLVQRHSMRDLFSEDTGSNRQPAHSLDGPDRNSYHDSTVSHVNEDVPLCKQNDKHVSASSLPTPVSRSCMSGSNDDTRSLRSDITTSSGLIVSGRSSTTSRPQTTRCHACKDGKSISENSDRAEQLEPYTTCVRCLRRYHTRCARGYEKDRSWKCQRCRGKSARQPLIETETDNISAVARSPLSTGPQRVGITASIGRLTEIGTLSKSTSECVERARNNSVNGSQSLDMAVPAGRGKEMTSSSPNNLAGAYERPGNGEPHIDNHQDLPNRNTIHVSSHYPEARQASGSVTQKNPTESQSNLEGANTALNGNLRPLADTDHGVTVTTKNTPGGSNQDRQVSTPSAPIVEEPTMPHDWSATNSRLHTVTQGDNPASNAPPISIAGRETQVAQIESSLNKDQVQSIIDPSRELLKSYSPGPVSHQSHGPSSSNPMARKCSGCSKAILSASDFCTKCQNENQPAVPEVQAAIEPSDKPPVAEASLNGLRPELATRANDAAPENPGSVKRQRSSLDADGNGHIFVPKKARLEYKPPKDARPKIVTAKKSSSNSSRWTTSQEMEKMLERLAKEKDRVRTLTLELSELRKREEDARQQVIEKERAIKSAENGQVLRVSEVEELRIRHEADQKELARLRREINDSAKCKSGLEPLPEDTTSREPVETDRGALNNEDAALEEHMKVLKAHGVVFETDSESDDDYTLVPKPQPKPRPRDPLWHRATTSKCLFEVAPYHLPPAMSRDALEAKKVEIASRPRRKQTFGKVLGHTKFERGVDPHKEVERTKEPMNMIITQREQSDSGWGHGDGEGTYESNVSFNKLVGIFDDPIPFLIDGQLAFRSGNTQGRRAKLFFPVGA